MAFDHTCDTPHLVGSDTPFIRDYYHVFGEECLWWNANVSLQKINPALFILLYNYHNTICTLIDDTPDVRNTFWNAISQAGIM